MASYKNLVYTDDQIKDAKKDVAALRKFTKALSDERIRVKKDLLKPYEDFEAKVKELTAIVDESIKNIDEQVKEHDEQRKAEKKAEIENIWSSITLQLPIPLTLEQIFNEKWLNASVSEKQIWEEIDARIKQIESDIFALQNLPEYSFEAIEVYKTSLNLVHAMQEGRRLAEIQKKKAEQEDAMKQAAEKDTSKKSADMAQEIEVPETPKNWVSFSAYINVEDAVALREFFKSRDIQYKAI